MSASTTTRSPTVRLMGYFPPSISGSRPSMTTRRKTSRGSSGLASGEFTIAASIEKVAHIGWEFWQFLGAGSGHAVSNHIIHSCAFDEMRCKAQFLKLTDSKGCRLDRRGHSTVLDSPRTGIPALGP